MPSRPAKVSQSMPVCAGGSGRSARRSTRGSRGMCERPAGQHLRGGEAGLISAAPSAMRLVHGLSEAGWAGPRRGAGERTYRSWTFPPRGLRSWLSRTATKGQSVSKPPRSAATPGRDHQRVALAIAPPVNKPPGLAGLVSFCFLLFFVRVCWPYRCFAGSDPVLLGLFMFACAVRPANMNKPSKTLVRPANRWCDG